jgi:hypothetical protein
MAEPVDPPASPADESFLDDYLETSPATVEKPRAVRQGLPASYRMRHDAHYVDELESRRAPAAASTRASEGTLVFPTSIPVTFALRDLSQELDGIASCFHLVPTKARPLRERLGLTLARVGVQRSMRAFHALRVLLEDPTPDFETVALNSLLERTLGSFDEELHLTESALRLQLHTEPISVKADVRLLVLAIQACVGTMVSLIEASGQTGKLIVTSGSSPSHATCEMHQDAYRMGADQFARLTDLEWMDRPGGVPAGIGLSAAARILQAHGGQLDARRKESGGCSLALSVPLATTKEA